LYPSNPRIEGGEMKLEDVPTPICSAEGGDGWSGSAECISLDTGLTLERKLGLAVAALESVAVDSQERFIRLVVKEALAQIESK